MNISRNISRKIIAMTIFMALVMAISTLPAMAAEKLIDTTISEAITKLDKNGNEYTRFIIQEQRSMSGVQYTIGVPVMVFGILVEKAKTIPEGAALKAIVSENEYQGRTNYNLIAFIE